MIPTFNCMLRHGLIWASKFHDSSKESGYEYHLIGLYKGCRMVDSYHWPELLKGPDGNWSIVDVFSAGVFVNGTEIDQRNRKLVRRRAWDGQLFWSWDAPDHEKSLEGFDIVKVGDVEFCMC